MLTSQLLLVLFSPIIGSFLGVVIDRLPDGRPLFWARSACPNCQRPLDPRDLVPVLSYLWLRGKCRRCHAPIGRFHLLVELASVAVALAVVMVEQDPVQIWFDSIFGWTLLILAWLDARCLWLPDGLTLPLAVLGLSVCAWRDPLDLLDRSAAAGLGYGCLMTVSMIYRKIRHKECLGVGDAKLFGACGSWIGSDDLFLMLFCSAMIALGTISIVWKAQFVQNIDRKIPFGSFICLSAFIFYLRKLNAQ